MKPGDFLNRGGLGSGRKVTHSKGASPLSGGAPARMPAPVTPKLPVPGSKTCSTCPGANRAMR